MVIFRDIARRDKYQHPFVLPPSTEGDQTANAGYDQEFAGRLKSRSVAVYRTQVDERTYSFLPPAKHLVGLVYRVVWFSLVVVSVTATTGPRGR